MTDPDRKTPDTPVIDETDNNWENAIIEADADVSKVESPTEETKESMPDETAFMRPKRGAAIRRATLNLTWPTDTVENAMEDSPAVSETSDEDEVVTPAATTETESDSELESEPVADTETDKEAETELQSESVVDTDTDADADKFTSIDPAEDISEATPEADEETPDEPSDEDSDELLDESSDQLPDERIEDVDDTTSEEKVEEEDGVAEPDVSSPLESEENIYEMISRIRHESTQIAPGVRSVRLNVEPMALPSETPEDEGPGSEEAPEELFVESVIQRAAAAVANAEPAGTDDESDDAEHMVEADEPEVKAAEENQEPPAPAAPVRPVLRYKTFAEARDFAKHTLPLPREMQTDGQQVNYQWLMAQLKVADTPERLHELAYRLNYKDLAVLFPTLATLSKRGPTEQIQTLIRTRASSYLYYHGWITLQFAYPRNAVAKALSDLCIQLEDRLYAFGNLIPARLGRRENRPDLGSNRMVWGDIPLISEIALPNSRHFLTDVAKAARESSYSLERFFNMYAIYDDLPLGQAILSRIAELQAGQTLDSPSLSKTFFERYRR